MSQAKDLLSDPAKFEEVAKAAFKNIDQDGNGEIDKHELKAALSHLSDKELTKIIAELDKDHSGKISYSEFKENIKKIIEDLF